MFGILERWNNNQVTPSLSKPHELSYRSNRCSLTNRYYSCVNTFTTFGIRHVPFYNKTCRGDIGYTPQYLADSNCQNIRHLTPEQLAMKWQEKSLHRYHPLVQDQPKLDKEASNLWFLRCELFPATKGFVVIIQDKVIGTRNNNIDVNNNVDVKCRLCGNPNETI